MRSTALSLFVGLVSLASPALAQGAVEVTASSLNVRTGAGTGNQALGLAAQGQVYPVLSRQGEWVQIQWGDRAGWCHGGYTKASTAQVLAVTASTLNVRTGPETRYRDIGDLPRGARVAVRASQGDWRRIDFQGREGWVHGDYLGTPGATPPPTNPPPGGRPTSAAGYIQLGASGPGFYCYGVASRRWGTPAMIYGIERVGRRWAQSNPNSPRMGVGDISAMNGGQISGHASHRLGVDADIRPMRTSGEAGVTRFQSAYSRAGTRTLIEYFQAEVRIVYIFFNDASIAGTTNWPNHDNHFHVRIRQ